jgi:hypothetical protein
MVQVVLYESLSFLDCHKEGLERGLASIPEISGSILGDSVGMLLGLQRAQIIKVTSSCKTKHTRSPLRP